MNFPNGFYPANQFTPIPHYNGYDEDLTPDEDLKKGIEYRGTNNLDKPAFSLFASAAQAGCKDANFHLGFMYEMGFGIEKDLDEAAECYRQTSHIKAKCKQEIYQSGFKYWLDLKDSFLKPSDTKYWINYPTEEVNFNNFSIYASVKLSTFLEIVKYKFKDEGFHSFIPVFYAILNLAGEYRRILAKETGEEGNEEFGLFLINNEKYDIQDFCICEYVTENWYNVIPTLKSLSSFFNEYKIDRIDLKQTYVIYLNERGFNLPFNLIYIENDDKINFSLNSVTRIENTNSYLTNTNSCSYSWDLDSSLIKSNQNSRWVPIEDFCDFEKNLHNLICKKSMAHHSFFQITGVLHNAIFWDPRKNSIEDLRDNLAKFFWCFSHASIFKRGQADISMWILEGILMMHSFKAVLNLDPNFPLDQLALSFFKVENFISYFGEHVKLKKVS